MVKKYDWKQWNIIELCKPWHVLRHSVPISTCWWWSWWYDRRDMQLHSSGVGLASKHRTGNRAERLHVGFPTLFQDVSVSILFWQFAILECNNRKEICYSTNLDRPCLQKVENQSKACQAVLWYCACIPTYTSTYSKMIFTYTHY